jgi:hypothetical protein
MFPGSELIRKDQLTVKKDREQDLRLPRGVWAPTPSMVKNLRGHVMDYVVSGYFVPFRLFFHKHAVCSTLHSTIVARLNSPEVPEWSGNNVAPVAAFQFGSCPYELSVTINSADHFARITWDIREEDRFRPYGHTAVATRDGNLLRIFGTVQGPRALAVYEVHLATKEAPMKMRTQGVLLDREEVLYDGTIGLVEMNEDKSNVLQWVTMAQRITHLREMGLPPWNTYLAKYDAVIKKWNFPADDPKIWVPINLEKRLTPAIMERLREAFPEPVDQVALRSSWQDDFDLWVDNEVPSYAIPMSFNEEATANFLTEIRGVAEAPTLPIVAHNGPVLTEQQIQEYYEKTGQLDAPPPVTQMEDGEVEMAITSGEGSGLAIEEQDDQLGVKRRVVVAASDDFFDDSPVVAPLPWSGIRTRGRKAAKARGVQRFPAFMQMRNQTARENWIFPPHDKVFNKAWWGTEWWPEDKEIEIKNGGNVLKAYDPILPLNIIRSWWANSAQHRRGVLVKAFLAAEEAQPPKELRECNDGDKMKISYRFSGTEYTALFEPRSPLEHLYFQTGGGDHNYLSAGLTRWEARVGRYIRSSPGTDRWIWNAKTESFWPKYSGGATQCWEGDQHRHYKPNFREQRAKDNEDGRLRQAVYREKLAAQVYSEPAQAPPERAPRTTRRESDSSDRRKSREKEPESSERKRSKDRREKEPRDADPD